MLFLPHYFTFLTHPQIVCYHKTMFEIDKSLFSRTILKPDHVSGVIAVFQEEEVRPTFGKLLVRLGLTWSQYEKLKGSDSPINQKSVYILELYKQHLESVFEEKLLYQENLPKFYNHGSLQFALKKLNPARYGDKVVEVSAPRVKSPLDLEELQNDSGYSITEKVVS